MVVAGNGNLIFKCGVYNNYILCVIILIVSQTYITFAVL